MNKANLAREQEFNAVKRKLEAMEKLNRHLNSERTKLLENQKGIDQNGSNDTKETT